MADKDGLVDLCCFRHWSNAQLLQQYLLAIVVLAQCITAASLRSIGSHQLPVRFFIAAILVQNRSGPARGVLVLTSFKGMSGERVAHGEIYLTQLLAASHRPVGIQIFGQKRTSKEAAGLFIATDHLWQAYILPRLIHCKKLISIRPQNDRGIDLV